MKKTLAVCLICLPAALRAPAQQIPASTEMLGQPFYVKTIWPIAGDGGWDFVKMDAAYRQLYIAHGNQVQAVDVETGLIAGTIRQESNRLPHNVRAIALDPREEFGYISDGSANEVQAFDRRTLKIVARIPTGPSPRALVYEPITGLLFAICSQPQPAKPSDEFDTYAQSNRSSRPAVDPVVYEPGSYIEQPAQPRVVQTKKGPVVRTPPAKKTPSTDDPPPASIVTVIDSETWTPLAVLVLSGRAGFAETDGQGRVFINIVDQNAIVRLEAQGIRDLLDEKRPISESELKHGKNRYTAIADGATEPLSYQSAANFQGLVSGALLLDWTNTSQTTRPPSDLWRELRLGAECAQPESLSIDGPHLRLFVACTDSKLRVVNADTGQIVTNAPIGLGTGVIEFDPARNLIYAANGDAGTLTIIRQHVTDSYQVVQNVPTTRHARVLAVNPGTGEVYVVTDSGKSGLAVLVVGH